jgi:hypothetical protein
LDSQQDKEDLFVFKTKATTVLEIDFKIGKAKTVPRAVLIQKTAH